MKIYFVRHGQSILNKEAKHQFPETPLSEIGKKEAKLVANRFKHIPTELIITSSYQRACETAQEIKKVTSAPVITSDLLIERKNPSEFKGKSYNDPEILPIRQMLKNNYHIANWHYSDEENFSDTITRVKAALEFIHSRKKETIVVVSHGDFLLHVISYIIFEETITTPLFSALKMHIEYSNTGLTLCEYKENTWKIITLNDLAHLGE